MWLLRTCCIISSLTLPASSALTDQTDPRLRSLFEQLKTAPGPDAASSIEDQIWTIWLEPSDPTIGLLLTNGISALSLGEHQVALEMFDELVMRAPNFAEGWNKRATVHYLLDNLQESLADINATLELEPRHFGALSGRGLVYAKLGDLERALTAFKEALEVSPQSLGPRANVKAIRALLGQRDI
jgi:tetratricopeptide (TPR) repeat protein